ncbi:hypothetical protein [Salinimicrobium terrae]|uniref:hypothetical protein n=1 Tax=Salinimicrobium terrae TaxID=470866 RepID=UPI0012EB2B6B|nr:hypothetical protein [Salinimicrobium terrae]
MEKLKNQSLDIKDHDQIMKPEENDLVLILTGTITPNSLSNLTVKDPALRRQQYLEAIKFYINKTKFKMVFIENSGDQLENFPILPERIEYLKFESAPVHPDRGIGYKELEIIEFAFKTSKFLKEVKMAVKITGRLKVLNISRLSGIFFQLTQKKSCLVYANIFKPKRMDSRCFFFTLDFWPYLLSAGSNIDLWYNFEASLWDATSTYQKCEGKSYAPLTIPLRIQGMSGSFGIQYKDNIVFHYARFIRNFSRKIMGNRSIS